MKERNASYAAGNKCKREYTNAGDDSPLNDPPVAHGMLVNTDK